MMYQTPEWLSVENVQSMPEFHQMSNSYKNPTWVVSVLEKVMDAHYAATFREMRIRAALYSNEYKDIANEVNDKNKTKNTIDQFFWGGHKNADEVRKIMYEAPPEQKLIVAERLADHYIPPNAVRQPYIGGQTGEQPEPEPEPEPEMLTCTYADYAEYIKARPGRHIFERELCEKVGVCIDGVSATKPKGSGTYRWGFSCSKYDIKRDKVFNPDTVKEANGYIFGNPEPDPERNKRVGDFVIVRNDGDASTSPREEGGGGEQAAARQMEAARQMAATERARQMAAEREAAAREAARKEVARRRQAAEAIKKAKKEKKKKREYALKVRTETYIAIKKKELGNVPKLPKAMQHFFKQRLQIEHKQELACMGYLNNEAVRNQVRLYAPSGGTVNTANPRYVITDVLQPLSGSEEAELQLKEDKEVQGLPWEVKDCDGMNPVEHSHGQADYQRIFANCKKGSLWLFTKDLVSSKGRQNFEVFCDAILPYNKDRYDKVVLSQCLEPYDCEEVSMQDAEAAIIAVWNSSDGTIHWKKSEPIPDRSPEINVNATTTPGNAAEAVPMDDDEDVLVDLGLPPLGPQSQ